MRHYVKNGKIEKMVMELNGCQIIQFCKSVKKENVYMKDEIDVNKRLWEIRFFFSDTGYYL